MSRLPFMREYEDITSALRAVQRHWQSGYTLWVSFTEGIDRVRPIGDRWAEELGTGLPAWKRQDRKQRNLANAVALCCPVFGSPGMREFMLMATPDALTMPKVSPWHRQNWVTSLPELSSFVMVREPRPRGDYTWTWRLQQHVEVGLARHLTRLVEQRERFEVIRHTNHAVALYPMFGGVRRQLKRILKNASKLWLAKVKSDWPGHDPEQLPAMIGFKAAKLVAAHQTKPVVPRKHAVNTGRQMPRPGKTGGVPKDGPGLGHS